MGKLPPGYLAKINRAKKHLEEFNGACCDYSGEGKAYFVVKNFDPRTKEFIFQLRVNSSPDVVSWSAIVGDCIHNARTALDHLFYRLVEIHNPAVLAGRTPTLQFPILKDATTFKGRHHLKDWVGDAPFALIEKLQPFNDMNGWNRNLLMFLHDFDIIDKHRLLLPAVSIADSVKIQPTTVENRTITLDGTLSISLEQLEDGAELGRLRASPLEDVVDLSIHLTFQVIFAGQPGPLFVTKCLEDVIGKVEEVAEEFRVFFSS